MITFLIVIFILLVISFFLFSSGTPNNLKELRVEFWQFWHGFLSLIEDQTVGLFCNKVVLYKQSSSVAVLTGGNRGIGLEVLKKLLQCDMTVVLGVRNIESARKSVESFIDDSLLVKQVVYETCDTGDLASVNNFAKRIQQNYKSINLLINNAGIMAVPYSQTKDGYESQMAVNYIGHFLLTHLLMPQLIAGEKQSQKPSRIVNVSSSAHLIGQIDYADFHNRRSYYTSSAYSGSKLAQAMFTNYLQKTCIENKWNVLVYSCHPGIVNTDIFNRSMIGSINFLKQLLMKSPEQGARCIVYAAIAPEIESKGGIYISNCRPSGTSAIAKDFTECKKLFNFTCNFLSIKHFGSEKSI